MSEIDKTLTIVWSLFLVIYAIKEVHNYSFKKTVGSVLIIIFGMVILVLIGLLVYSFICVGLGAWEVPDTTLQLKGILESKGIHTWVDVWGSDCEHDWPWWHKQVPYFMPWLLGDR